ncbi:MAG: hypothetical protein R3E86_03975 [Pseudomonadales bacterium]
MTEFINTGFSLVRGGPMHRLLQRLRLLDDDELPGARVALTLACIAWLPLVLFALAHPRPWSTAYASNVLVDAGAYARYLIAIPVLVIVDRSAHWRLNRLLGQFVETGIIARDSRTRFDRALVRADRWTGSTGAEAIMLLLAYALSAVTMTLWTSLDSQLWFAGHLAGLSLAGWWAVLLSTPLHFFLTLRWLWRLFVWAWLLTSISGLPLHLIPTHPDRVGGLGFLTLFPMIFVPLIFALSAVVAASALQQILFGQISSESVRGLAGIWSAVVGLLFIGPLCVFSRTLMRLRETALLEYGELVARFHRRTLQSMLEHEGDGRLADSEALSAMPDLAHASDTVRSIRLVPIELWTLIPVAIAALAPMLAIATVDVPLRELMKRLLGALL